MKLGTCFASAGLLLAPLALSACGGHSLPEGEHRVTKRATPTNTTCVIQFEGARKLEIDLSEGATKEQLHSQLPPKLQTEISTSELTVCEHTP